MEALIPIASLFGAIVFGIVCLRVALWLVKGIILDIRDLKKLDAKPDLPLADELAEE